MEQEEIIKQINLTLEFQRRIRDGEEALEVANDLGIELTFPI